MSRAAADRRRAVARVLREERPATQEALVAALSRGGWKVTQATLSRDLARLGARRVSRPDGAFYELGDGGPDEAVATVASLVTSVATNGWLVVVRTVPGSAPAVARAVDLARVDGVLGTLAGDDTVFVAPSTARGARGLAGRLGRMLGPAGEPRPS